MDLHNDHSDDDQLASEWWPSRLDGEAEKSSDSVKYSLERRTDEQERTARVRHLQQYEECPRCGQRFGGIPKNRRQHLKRHITSKHGESRFRCDHQGCNRSYNRVDNLIDHKRIVHGLVTQVEGGDGRGGSRSNKQQLDRAEHAESEPSEPQRHIVLDETQNFVANLADDDDELFRQFFNFPSEEPPAYVQPSVDGRDMIYTTIGTDSTTTATSHYSGKSTDSLHVDRGSETFPQENERTQASSMFGTESELPQKVKEDREPNEDEDDVYEPNAQETPHKMIDHDPQPPWAVDGDDMDVRFKLLHKSSQARRRSDSETDSFIDETMSIQSYADTIFDNGSVGSSMSSVHSDTQALFVEYVDFLVCDPALEKLFLRSMSPTVLGPERFRRNYSRILQSYARDLRRQPASQSDGKAPLYAQGLAFISRRSTTMKTASLIASRYIDRAPRSRTENEDPGSLDQQAEFENDESSGDESPENEPSHTLMISELRSYFREGAPFQRMKRNLRNLVIPSTLLNRVKASTEHILDLVLGDEYLRFLLFKALSDPLVPVRGDQIDPETEIRYFGSRLRVEANSPDHLRVAGFIETYARYIGARAAQRMEGMDMEAILQESRFDAHYQCKIIVEDRTGQQQPQSHIERKTDRTSQLRRAISQVRRGAIGVFGFMLSNIFLAYVLGKALKELADSSNYHTFTRFIAVFMLVCVCGAILDATIATLFWSCSTASAKRPEIGTDALRYFAHTWNIGDGDDLEQKFRSHIWKPYRKYLSSTSEEVLENIIDDNLPNLCDADIDTHWPLVASSKIFEKCVDCVRDAAIPTFFSQAKRLVAEGLVGVEEPNAATGKTNLLCALEEVQWCFTQTGVAPTICISASEPSLKSFRVSNLVKLAVEGSSRSMWQWWPLQPPNSRGKARDTECRISWKCNCGTEREEIVPFVYASKLGHLASQFPLNNEPPERPPSSLSNSSSQATGTTSGSEAQSASSGASSAIGSSSLRSSTVATSPSSSVVSFGTPPKAFVFLVVKASRYILAPIDVTEKKARDFFQAIVENYNMKRGWRRLLSIYVYSHCDFVKIKRYAPRSFDPGVRFSFPPHDESPHDKEYGYYPRPMPHAPVSRHMFNHLFNACYSDEGLAHKLHYAFIAPSCVIKSIPGKLLDGMPKRDRLVDEEAEFGEDQDVEVFWGLVAREQRLALRVVIYMLLGLGPSLWFMFQWLFGWGHDGDLQDATVPLMFSATMLGILWAVVYSGDDVREVEQPR